MQHVAIGFSFASQRLALGRLRASSSSRWRVADRRRLTRLSASKRRRSPRLRSSRRDDEPILEFDQKTTARDDYDAICVLGGGYLADGTLPRWVSRRLELASTLFERQTRSCVVLCVGGGTPHKPPLQDEDGYTIHEATLLAADLLLQGFDARYILKEFASYDTVGNAYFTLTSHAIPAQWSRMAVVTSNFHMPRTQALYTDIFHLGRDFLADPFLMEFFAASDEGVLSPVALNARRTREAMSLATWKQNSVRFENLPDFHRWLYTTHQCYAVARQHESTISNLNSSERKTY